jgi:hypothetical protein
VGLADPAVRVRGRAAGLVYAFDLSALLPEPGRLSRVEEPSEARHGVLRAPGLIRVGYSLEPRGPRAFRVEYVGPAYGLCCASVGRSQVEERGIEATVAGLWKLKGDRI